MDDDYEIDAVLLQDLARFEKEMESSPAPVKQVVDYLTLIENTMDWYDHLALAFLLYDDPQLARHKIKVVLEHHRQNSPTWRKIVLQDLFEMSKKSNSQREMWKKLMEALHILKQKKLLKEFEVEMIETGHVNAFRRKLFNIIDGLSADEALEKINESNSKPPKMNTDYTDGCIEMQVLEWLEDGTISETNLMKLCNNSERTMELKKPTVPIGIIPKPWMPSPASCKFEIFHGLCIIINQVYFYVDPSLPHEIRQHQARELLAFRYGSEVDRDRLSETFRTLSHEVEVYENLNREKLLATMKEIGNRDLRKYDGLVVCILSHGERNCIYSTDSISIPLDELKSFFNGHNCPYLLDKPKLFFLQACQGQSNQEGVRMTEEFAHDGGTLPAVSNFFEAWATVPGFFSYRSTYRGAIFIRDLCDALQEFGHNTSLLDLMTNVNQRVGGREIGNGNKQICSITYSLTKSVQFKRAEGEQFVQAIADQLERELQKRIIELAACLMLKKNRQCANYILDTRT